MPKRDNWVIGSGAWSADICYIKQWFSLSPQGCINLGHPISPRIPTACRLHPSTSSLPHLTPYGRGQNWSSEGREHALPPRGNTFSSIHARFLERKRAAESTKKLRNRQNYQFLINERETIQNHIQTTLLLGSHRRYIPHPMAEATPRAANLPRLCVATPSAPFMQDS